MKNEKAAGVSLAVVLAGFSLICGILVYTVPDFALSIAGFLTHSTIPFSINPFDPAGFVFGIALWAVLGFVGGVAFAKLYKATAK